MDMNDNYQNSNPLDSIIDFAWASGANRFWVNNAKDELKKLRKNVDNLSSMIESLTKKCGKGCKNETMFRI